MYPRSGSDDRVLDDAQIGHDNHQRRAVGHRNQLNVPDAQRAQLRRDDHRRVVGRVREDAGRAADYALHLIRAALEMLVHLLALVAGKARRFQQMIDVEPIGLYRRDSPRGGVRLVEVAKLLEVAHLVADRGGGEADAGLARNGARSHGHGRGDVVVDDRLKNQKLSIVQRHLAASPFVGFFRVSTHNRRVLTLEHNVPPPGVFVNRFRNEFL